MQVLMLASPTPPPPLPVNTVNIIPSGCMSVYDVLDWIFGMLTMRFELPASNPGTPYATESVSIYATAYDSSDQP
jgi:hypothetical protein